MLVIVWEFRVKAGQEAEFERRYGPAGEWVGVLGGHFVDIALGSEVKEFRSHVDLARRVHEMFVGK